MLYCSNICLHQLPVVPASVSSNNIDDIQLFFDLQVSSMKISLDTSSIKIIFPAIFTFLLVVLLLFAYVIPQFENNILERKKDMMMEMTHSIVTILSYYERKEQQGELTHEQAQDIAKDVIRNVRYGPEKKDYLWINDMTPVMVMHPYRPDLENKNVADFQVKKGVFPFKDFVTIAKKNKDGFVKYMWQWKDNNSKIVSKLSYVQLFEPWNWIVGTGVYTEDVREEINTLSKRISLIATGVLIIIILVEYWIVTNSIKIERNRKTAVEELKKHHDHLDLLVKEKIEDIIMMNNSLKNEIEERNQTAKELLQSEERYSDLIDNVHDLIQSIRPDGSFEYVNRSWRETMGYSDSEIADLKVFDLLSPENKEDCITNFQRIIAGEEMRDMEVTYLSKNGEDVLLKGNASCRLEKGKPLFTRGIFRDITERTRAENQIKEQNKLLRNIIESLPYPFYVINADDYSIILANSQATIKHNYEGVKCHNLTHGCDSPCRGEDGHSCPLDIVKTTKNTAIVEHTHYDRHGRKKFVEIHGYPIFNVNGEVSQMIESSFNITDRKILEQKIEQDSITDELTGLFNRRGFFLIAEKQLQIAKRNDQNLFLLYADLDNIKTINDQLGHQQGDKALQEITQILQDTFRAADILARIGGDEFIVLMHGDNEIKSQKDIIYRLEKNIEQNNQDNNKRAYELSISSVIGVFNHNAPCELDQIIREADALMYAAKQKKKKKNSKQPAISETRKT